MPLKEDGNKVKKTVIFDKADYEKIVRLAEENKRKNDKENNSTSKIIRNAIKSYLKISNNELSILIKYTQRELLGYFTYNEAVLMINAFNGTLYDLNSLIPPKTLLFGEIEDSINYDFTDSLYNVDKTTLLNKINKLTEFQCYVVISKCFEFWTLEPSLRQGELMTDAIKNLFLVWGENSGN